MKLHMGSLIGAILGGVLLAAAPAGATSVTWAGANGGTVGSGFVSGVSSYTALNFPTSASSCPGSSSAFCTGGTSTVGGFTISGTGLQVNYDSDYSNTVGFEASSITVTTPVSGINAFFIQLGDSVAGAPITVTLSDGETISSVNSQSLNSPTYFGISISHDITSFSVSTTSGNIFLDEMYSGVSTLAQDSGSGDGSGDGSGSGDSGDPSATPEAATILLIGGGLLALVGSRRKWVAARLAV
ncbi:MAG: PEP-CTERM sorting domain-containing protein [Bryobacteraceae bacterium]